ncbi:hypothetical protein VOLCADRAFT_106891 [Volvox carteri f. nagariensis]|uniref:RING-type domain-containing protein n=1 Tax=Volvox carteri f. nagariensis TaxID=3068 RepID=D8UAG2_VOLCA|nr:uncharacterized protein VOLCADRAFT_106891 [Volvox carteri f. nagariensis]EFJ43315.1 hypothetical protein VOLCADRAFT_106891 [Volvox carteri f. nagariensis]|eukprot:XP_002955675.1 hypothetical protein VOLCADRAFT_106891 [Volvox carteri f. nagariensis]
MNHGACMKVFGAEKSPASAMEVLEKPPCTVLYPQGCVQALCGFDGSSCGVKYASFAAFAPAVLDTDAGMQAMFSDLLSQRGLRSTAPLPGPLPMPGARPARPSFLQQLAERRRRVIGGMSCPGLRDECYACLYGCSQAGVLGPRDIEAAIMDTGGDAGRALAWYPGLLMAWRFDKADTFFRDNQLPAYYGEIDSIRSGRLQQDYSRNGTFLNGIPLQPGRQTTLANGDRISLVLSINPLAEVSYVYEEASLMALMSVDRPEECELFNDSCGGSSPLKSSLPRPRPPLSYIDGDACQGQVKVLLRPCTSSLPCNVQRAVSAEAGLAAVAAAGPSSPHPLHPQQPSVPLAHLRSPDRRRLSRTASSTAGFGGHSGGGGSVAVGTVRRRPRHVPPTEPMGCRTVDGGGGDGNDFIGPMKHGIGGSSDDAVVSPTSTPHRRCCTAPGRGYPISHVRSGGVAAVTASASTSAAARGAADFGRRDGTVPGAVSAGLAHRTDRTTANRATAWDAFAFMEAEAFAARDVALIRWPSSVPSPPGIEPGSINTAMPPPGAASVFAPDRRLRCAHSPIQSCPLPQTSSPASPPACPRQPIGRALPPPVPQPSLSPSPADAAATAGGSCGGSMRSGAGSGAGRPRWRPSRLLHSSSPGSLLSDMKGTAAEHDATPPATGQKLQRPSPPPQSSARDAVAANVQEDDAPGMAAAKLVAALAVEPRRGRRRNTRTGADGEDGCEAAGGGGESSQTTSEDDAHSFSFSIAWRPRVSPPPTPPPSSCGDAAAAAAGGSPHWADVRESICSAAGEGPGPGLLRGRFTQAAGASGCDRGDEKGISASAAAAAAAATAAPGKPQSQLQRKAARAAAASTDTGSICPYLPYTPITLRQRLLSSCYRDAHTTGVEGSGVRSVCDSNDNYGSGGSDRDGSGNPHSAQGSSRTSAGNWSNQCCGDSWMDISVDGCGRGTASGNDGGGDDAPVSSSYSCVSGAHPTGNAAVVVGAANAASAASAAARRRYSSPDSEESVYDNLRSGIYCGRDTVEGVLGDHHRDRPSVAAVMVDRTPDVIRRRRAVALGSYESMTLGNDPQSVPRRARCHILSPSAANPGAFLPSLALRTNLTPAAVASTHATPGTDDDDDVDDDNGYDGAVTAAATCVASRLVQQRHQQQLREALDSPQPPSPPSPPSLSFVMPPPTSSGVAVRPSPALAMQHLMTCSGSDALDPVVPGTCRYSPRCGPEALLCGLCGDYLQRAIAVHPCGHTYCGSCLSEHLSSLMAAGCRLGCPEGCTVFTHLAANQPARRLEEILVGPRHNDGGCEQERIGTGSSGGVAGATAAAAMALPLGGGGLAATALTPGAAGNLAALNPGPRDSGGSGTADAVAAGASNAGAETPARFQTTTADIGGVQGPSSAVPRARPERMQHEDSPAPHHRNLTGRHNAVPSPSQSPLQRCLLYTPAGRFPQTESTTTATAASDASSTAGSYGGEDGGGDGDGARIGERRTRHRRDGDAAGGILHDMGALGRTVDGGVSELCPLPDGILPLPAVRLHLRQAEHLLLRLRGVMGLRPEAAPNAGAVPDADDVAAARCLELLCPLTRLATTQPEAREALSAMGAIQGCLLVMEQQQRIQLQRDRQHLLEQLNRHRQRQHLPQQQRQQHHHQQPMPSSHGGRCNCHPNCNSCYCSTDRLDVDPEPLRNPCNGDQSNDGNADVGAGAGGGMSFHCDELDISDRNLDPAGRHNVVTTAAVASTTRNNGQGGSSSGGPRMTASSPFPRASASSPSPSYDDGASTWHSSFTAAADHVVVPCSGTAATPAAAVSAHRESWGPAPAQTLLAKGSTAAAPTDDLAVCRQSLMAQRAACGLLVALLTAVGPDDGCQQSNQWYMARLGAVDVLLRLLRRAADTVAAMETAAAAAAAEAETKTEAVNLTLVRERRTYGEGQGVLDHLRQVQRRQCWQQLQLEDEADFLAIAVLTVLRLMVAENTMTQAHLACDGTAAVLGLLRDMPRSVGVQTAGLQLVAQMAQGDDVTHTAIRHCLVEKGAVQLAVAALGGCGDAVCGGSGRRGVGAGNAAAYHSQCQSQGSSVGDERVTGRAGGGSSGGGARGPLSAAALAALKALLTAPIPDLLRKALASELRRVGALARIRSSLREFEAEVEDRWLLTTARRLEKQIVEVMAANHWWRWRRSSVACGSGGGGGGSWELSWGLLAAAAGVGFALGASASAVVVGAFLV